MVNSPLVRELILSKPTAVGQLGGYYSGSSGPEVRYTGMATIQGNTVSYADRTDPFIVLSPAFAEKASTSGVSVSYNSRVQGSVVTPGAATPVYGYTNQGESLGPTRNQPTNNIPTGDTLAPEWVFPVLVLVGTVAFVFGVFK